MAWVAWLAATLFMAPALAQSPLPAALDYAAWPQVQRAVISPNNDKVALIVRERGKPAGLAVKPLDGSGPLRMLVLFGNVDVVWAEWVGPRRLVYSVQAPGARIAYDEWGTFAIDDDGSDEQQLISARSDNQDTGSRIKSRALTRIWEAVGPDAREDHLRVRMYAQTLERGYVPITMASLNTRTMVLTPLTEGQPEHAAGWLFDAQGRLRVVQALHQGRSKLWWRGADLGAWQLLQDEPFVQGSSLAPVAMEDDESLVVSARQDSDFLGLHVYDVKRRRLESDALVQVKGFDVFSSDAIRERHTGRLLGVQFDAHTGMTAWFDERLSQLQQQVDATLPGRSNFLRCGRCANPQRLLVASGSAQQPLQYYVLDVRTRQLSLLGEARPWMKAEPQGRRTFHRVPARDGLSLPVVVTHPPGTGDAQALPTVLLVHGGPWVRGTDTAWQAEPQFLASRGYRVVEVDFRGSIGLGWNHYRAGWKQWGLAMQDDLEDAVLWAVKQGLSDERRVCIYGGSYGGYAALMGLVRHPTRYRCAVSHVGVTDPRLLFSGNWTDIAPFYREHRLSQLVGDPQQDAELLKQAAPIERVADIKAPVLLVQGRLDRRVSPEHADRFVSAARRAGVDIERHDFEEGHGWFEPDNHAAFLALLERFFARHIGPGR